MNRGERQTRLKENSQYKHNGKYVGGNEKAPQKYFRVTIWASIAKEKMEMNFLTHKKQTRQEVVRRVFADRQILRYWLHIDGSGLSGMQRGGTERGEALYSFERVIFEISLKWLRGKSLPITPNAFIRIAST